MEIRVWNFDSDIAKGRVTIEVDKEVGSYIADFLADKAYDRISSEEYDECEKILAARRELVEAIEKLGDWQLNWQEEEE